MKAYDLYRQDRVNGQEFLRSTLRERRQYYVLLRQALRDACDGGGTSALLEAFGEDDGAGGKTVPSDFYVAALMLTKHLYEHRGPTEMVTQSMVPYTLDLLIKPFMRLTTGEEGSV